VLPAFEIGADIAPELITLAHDPQTSGGLLAAIPAVEVDDVTGALSAAGVQAWRVGSVQAGEPGVALI
jgi:selenide,water dikinase